MSGIGYDWADFILDVHCHRDMDDHRVLHLVRIQVPRIPMAPSRAPRVLQALRAPPHAAPSADKTMSYSTNRTRPRMWTHRDPSGRTH